MDKSKLKKRSGFNFGESILFFLHTGFNVKNTPFLPFFGRICAWKRIKVAFFVKNQKKIFFLLDKSKLKKRSGFNFRESILFFLHTAFNVKNTPFLPFFGRICAWKRIKVAFFVKNQKKIFFLLDKSKLKKRSGFNFRESILFFLHTAFNVKNTPFLPFFTLFWTNLCLETNKSCIFGQKSKKHFFSSGQK